MKVNLNARALSGLVQWVDEDRSGDLSVGDRVRVGKDHLVSVRERHLKDHYATAEFLSRAYLGKSGLGRLSFLIGGDASRQFLVYSEDKKIHEVRDLVTGKILPMDARVDAYAELAEALEGLDEKHSTKCALASGFADTLWECDQLFIAELRGLQASAKAYARAYAEFDAARVSLEAFYAKTPRTQSFYDYRIGEKADAFVAAQEAFRGQVEAFHWRPNGVSGE